MNEEVECELCGAPMPTGEEMFRYHGHSGPCPRPPMVPRTTLRDNTLKCGICGHSEQEFIDLQREVAAAKAQVGEANQLLANFVPIFNVFRLVVIAEGSKEHENVLQDFRNKMEAYRDKWLATEPTGAKEG